MNSGIMVLADSHSPMLEGVRSLLENVGNSVDYSKDQKAWVANQHATGNQVRVNAGNRYAGAYNNGVCRQGAIGGYPYYNGWTNRGPYYAWHPVPYAAVGTFLGAAWVSAQPRYYAYGSGGNVYYENNIVYVDGQAAGTPEQYAQQSTALVASAPAQVTDTEWLPLRAFALTREGVPALLHQGQERSTPVLLVRLHAPADNAGS